MNRNRMPRKYDKKTRANFRGGRRNSRRLTMQVLSPGFSAFDDEFDPCIDETMLMLKAKGADRERERFAEALSEVRDKISKIVDDYDAMLEESAYIYRDYIDELEGQVLVMPGSKLKQNILRILADYKLVCAEREELLFALEESMAAQVNSMKEVPLYFEVDDEFDFYTSEASLRDYNKTVRWLSEKLRDMDAKVNTLKKRGLTKSEKKRLKKEKQKEKAKAIENLERLEAATSKERLDTWKYAAEEIVELLKTVRQEGEGGKEILAVELQKIITIMSKQNEEIEKKKEMLHNEKEAHVETKQQRDKLQAQLKTLEERLKVKSSEITRCKQFIQEMMEKMKETDTKIEFTFTKMDEDFNDELPNVVRETFSSTESNVERDFTSIKIKEAQKRTSELEENNSKLQKEIANLEKALAQKDRQFVDLKTEFSQGISVPCPNCKKPPCTPDSMNDSLETKLEGTPEASGLLEEEEIVICQTSVDSKEKINENGEDQQTISASITILKSVESSGEVTELETPGTDLIIVEGGVEDEGEESQKPKKGDKKQKKRKGKVTLSARKNPLPSSKQQISHPSFKQQTLHPSAKQQTGRRSALLRSQVIQNDDGISQNHEGVSQNGESISQNDERVRENGESVRRNQESVSQNRKSVSESDEDLRQNGEGVEERSQENREDLEEEMTQKTVSLKSPDMTMVNKSVQTIYEGLISAHDKASTREGMEDLKEEMTSPATKKIETGWRAKLHALCSDIEEIIENSEAGAQLERMLSYTMTEGSPDNRVYYLHSTDHQLSQDASARKKSIFMRLIENQTKNRGSLLTGIKSPHIMKGADMKIPLPHLPPLAGLHKDSCENQETHTLQQPDPKGDVARQSLLFRGEEAAPLGNAKFRRGSIFDNKDLMEKIASASIPEYSELAGDENTGQHPKNAQNHKKVNKAKFRPSIQNNIKTLNEKNRIRLQSLYYQGGDTFGVPSSVKEESEIEVGALLKTFRRNSLRKAFLSMGLLHLKGENDDVKEDELLTMEDQVNIVAQTAMEVLKATIDAFSKRREQPQQVMMEEENEESDGDESEAAETNEIVEAGVEETAMFAPMNTPEDKFEEDKRTEDRLPPIKDSAAKNEKINQPSQKVSLPELAKRAEPPTPQFDETREPSPPKERRYTIRPRLRQLNEQRRREIPTKYAQKGLNRSTNPFRSPSTRKAVMERILGAQMAALGNMLGVEQDQGLSAINSLSRKPLVSTGAAGGDSFSLTAQSIKLPTAAQSVSHAPRPKPISKQQGITKTTSLGSHGQRPAANGGKFASAAIEKARSVQTQSNIDRLFVGSEGQKPAKWQMAPMRLTGIRKKF